jgi:catechol 2,3-dioxygenase-like lactoylglutathione lyase family enzyme
MNHPLAAIHIADALMGEERYAATRNSSPDLAVSDVERSLAFYVAVLGAFGLHEEERYPTYRGTEEVVYLRYGEQYLGLRPADGGEHNYYGVGIEHLAFYVDSREEVDAAYQRCLDIGARIHSPAEDDRDIEGY